MTVTDFIDFLERAESRRDTEDQPFLHIVAQLPQHVTADGTVLERIGQVGGQPAYEIVPRMYKVTGTGGLELCDDHPSWFEAGNDEQIVIDRTDLTLVVLSNPGNPDIKTRDGHEHVLMYPPTSDGPESVWAVELNP